MIVTFSLSDFDLLCENIINELIINMIFKIYF